MKIIVFIFILLMNIQIFSQTENEKFRIFDAKGNQQSFDQIIEEIKKSDVVFLGENHDDTVAHALQFEIFKAAFEKYGKEKKITLSLEMFERDVQTVLNEYLNSLISEQHFLASSRPWGNYKTDYRPLVEFAKENKLEVIAANAPRRYVNMVSRLGRDSLNNLSPEAKKWLAPLPYGEASDAYAAKFNALMGQMSDSVTPQKHSPILNSQALWDATMAFWISENLKKNKNSLIVHLNGAFHTENRLGTVEHLLKYRKKTKVLVVTMRYVDEFRNFDKSKYEDLGDFVILTDAKQPRSQR
ncbi:MAG: ChaN family lipoprotein [Pyrinomonadaceae bacterium]